MLETPYAGKKAEPTGPIIWDIYHAASKDEAAGHGGGRRRARGNHESGRTIPGTGDKANRPRGAGDRVGWVPQRNEPIQPMTLGNMRQNGARVRVRLW